MGDLGAVLNVILDVCSVVLDVFEDCFMGGEELRFRWPVEVLESH